MISDEAVEAVSILPTASGGWSVSWFDGTVFHYVGTYPTKQQADKQADKLRTK